MSIPASSMNVLIYLAIVADESSIYDIINSLSFPVKWFLSGDVCFLYSAMQAMMLTFVFSRNFVNISGSWCLPGLDVFTLIGI